MEDLALKRRDGSAHATRGLERRAEIIRDPGVEEHGTDGILSRARHAHDVQQGADSFHRRVIRLRNHQALGAAVGGIGDDEADAARVVRFGQPDAGIRLIVGANDDVLEQLANAGFDRALVLAVDVEIVRDRSHLADLADRRFRENQPCAVAILRARRVQLLERLESRGHAGKAVLESAQLRAARLAVGASAGQLRLAAPAVDAQRLESLVRPRHRVFRGESILLGPRSLRPAGPLPRPPASPAAPESAPSRRSRAPSRGAAPWLR